MPRYALLVVVGALALTIGLLALAFAGAERIARAPTPDLRWAALATEQQRAFLGTRVASPVPARGAQGTPATATATRIPAATPAATPTATTPPVATSTPSPTQTATPSPAAASPGPTSTTAPPPTAPPSPTNGTPLPSPSTVIVPAGGVNLREGPGPGFALVAVLDQGEVLTRVGSQYAAGTYLWVEVVTADGRHGWVYGESLGLR